jgi:hypothetical protein
MWRKKVAIMTTSAALNKLIMLGKPRLIRALIDYSQGMGREGSTVTDAL